MSEYLINATQESKTQGEIRKLHKDMSLPRVWDENVCSELGITPVLNTPKPTPSSDLRQFVRNGTETDSLGNTVQAWMEVDKFSDYTDEEGVTHTKAEQESAYTARENEKKAESVRSKRNQLLQETDFYALSDVTMSPEMATYRQALRDITTHANFPDLSDEDYPVKP